MPINRRALAQQVKRMSETVLTLAWHHPPHRKQLHFTPQLNRHGFGRPKGVCRCR